MSSKDEEPADRLESALNRIAFALEHRHGVSEVVREPVSSTPGVDLHALAANIDVLTMRIRDLLDETAPSTGPSIDGEG